MLWKSACACRVGGCTSSRACVCICMAHGASAVHTAHNIMRACTQEEVCYGQVQRMPMTITILRSSGAGEAVTDHPVVRARGPGHPRRCQRRQVRCSCSVIPARCLRTACCNALARALACTATGLEVAGTLPVRCDFVASLYSAPCVLVEAGSKAIRRVQCPAELAQCWSADRNSRSTSIACAGCCRRTGKPCREWRRRLPSSRPPRVLLSQNRLPRRLRPASLLPGALVGPPSPHSDY